MESAPHGKKRRQDDSAWRLLSTARCSQRALVAICNFVRDQPLEGPLARRRLHRIVADHFAHVKEVLVVPLDSGDFFEWPVISPQRQLVRMLELSPQLLKAYRDAAAVNNGVWNLVVAFDELTPGDAFRIDNHRKSMNVMVNFRELGHLLSRDCTWIIVTVVRHEWYEEAVGGWSRMLGDLLAHILVGAVGFTTAGVALPLAADGTVVLLYARLGNIVADLDGLRMGFDWKGSNGLRPCVECGNCLKLGSDLAPRGAEYYEISCPDADKFIRNTDADLARDMDFLVAAEDRVAAGTMQKGRWEKLEKIMGLNTNRDGILGNPALRSFIPCLEVVTLDWMHGLLCDGVFNTEVFAFLSAIEKKLQVDIWPQLKAYLESDWVLPSAAGHFNKKKLALLFSKAKEDSSKRASKMKFQATELLCAYSLVRQFCEERFAADQRIAREWASFSAACAVVDLVLHMKRTHEDHRLELKGKLASHMRCHVAAYGEKYVKPKHHAMLAHLWRQHPQMLDAFVPERLNHSVKVVAANMTYTASYESSVLGLYLAEQERRLTDPKLVLEDSLMGPLQDVRDADALGSEVVAAPAIQIGGRPLHRGDVVFKDGNVGVIRACLSADGVPLLLVQPFRARPHTRHSCKGTRVDALDVWGADGVGLAVAWRVDGAETLAVLE